MKKSIMDQTGSVARIRVKSRYSGLGHAGGDLLDLRQGSGQRGEPWSGRARQCQTPPSSRRQ
jgi:hypothetical protein